MLYVIIITTTVLDHVVLLSRVKSIIFFKKMNIKGSFLSFPFISVNKIKIVNEQTKHKGFFPFI